MPSGLVRLERIEETYHRWKEVLRRCGIDDWTLWALTQRNLQAPAHRASFYCNIGRELRLTHFGTTKGTFANLCFSTNRKTLRFFPPTGIPKEDVTFSFAHRQSDYLRSKSLLFHQLLDLDMSFCGITRGDMSIVRGRAGLWDYHLLLFIRLSEEEVLCFGSMASVSRVSRRKDASRWPRMSSTFWAVVLLTALLVLYCGKSPRSFSDRTYRHLGALETKRWCAAGDRVMWRRFDNKMIRLVLAIALGVLISLVVHVPFFFLLVLNSYWKTRMGLAAARAHTHTDTHARARTKTHVPP